MDENNGQTTRRGALGRILGVAVGAAGIGAFAESKASAGAPAAGSKLTLYIPHMRQKQVGTDARNYLPFGAVIDAKGRELGSLHTASLDSTGGALTMQTFELADGKIVGIGSNDTYVVVGSTGKYAGVAGSYVERLEARLPGREFTFTFREGSNGS